MLGLTGIIDPTEAPLELVADENAIGFHLFSPLKVSTPQAERLWAGNIDTEGELPAGSRDQNMEITPKLRITGSGEADFRTRQLQLEQKVHKLKGEGGVFRLLYPDGTWIDYWVRDVSGGERLFDNRFIHNHRTEDEITFVCAPFGVGQEELVGEFSGSSRLLEAVVDHVGGSAPALARAEITSPDADVWDLRWSADSRHYSDAATAKCLYAAKDLVPLGGATATTATVDGKAGTSVVRQGTLSPNWTAQLSTGPLTHEGVVEIYAWVHTPATNTGEVGILFEYGVGDLSQRTELERIYFPAGHPRQGKVVLVVLGQSWIRASGRGAHRWEGQFVTKSSVAGDDFDILDVGIRPVEERNGRVAIAPVLRQPAALLIRDEFNQTSGVLNNKVIAAAGRISGPLTPGAVVNDASIGTKPWTAPGNWKTSDDTWAVVTLALGEFSNYLKATNFGFEIPAGATIEGVVAHIEGEKTGGYSVDAAVRLVKGGVIQAGDRSNPGPWPAKDVVRVYGSPTDLWGTTLTGPDVSSGNFGIAFAVGVYPGSTGTSAEMDAVSLTIFWADSEGQKWVTSGDPTDIAVDEATHTASRSEVSDADINTGRYAVAGATVTTDIVAGVKEKRTPTLAVGERVRSGALARYVDNSNWLFFGSDFEAVAGSPSDTLRVVKRVAGTVKELDRVAVPQSSDFLSFYLHVDRRGRYFCWGALLDGGVPRLLMAGQDNDLATGGALDDGKNGFYDAKTGATAATRNYDQFVAWIAPLQAAIFQGLTLELTHDICRREVEGGGIWAELTPEADYLKLAPSGMENRRNRLTFIASPHDPNTMGVGFPTALKVALYVTPRYRGVPDPA